MGLRAGFVHTGSVADLKPVSRTARLEEAVHATLTQTLTLTLVQCQKPTPILTLSLTHRGPNTQGDSKKQSTPQSKREKLAAKLTSPLQPPNPSEKGTQLHMRIQYRDLSLEQVRRGCGDGEGQK